MGQYADVIYDICKEKNVNPMLCAAVAQEESNCGKAVPVNATFNYWGLGVFNHSNRGVELDTMEGRSNLLL